MVEARDIYEECYAIYVSTYSFEEKKEAILKHLATKNPEALQNAAVYANLKNMEYTKLKAISQFINTLTFQAILNSKQKQS